MNPFQYTVRDFDSETGLHYNRARYYDSNGGRFLSEDPTMFAGSGPNFYVYVFNGPIGFSDPTGFAPDIAACAKQAIFDCAKQLFNVIGKNFVQTEQGKIGRFDGTTADGNDFTLFNDAQRFSTDELSLFRDHWRGMDPSGPVRGLTANSCRWARFRFYCLDYHTSYTGNNLAPGDTQSTQWHELGHQLAGQVGFVNKKYDYEDPWGVKMETCIQKRLIEIIKQLTQKPH